MHITDKANQTSPPLYSATDLVHKTPQEVRQILRKAGKLQNAYLYSWSAWARPDQMHPVGDWRLWLVLAGRGYGKTRMGAEWVRMKAHMYPGCRIALIGSTMAEARSIMVEGESGLLSLLEEEAPEFTPSLNRISWENGSQAFLYSASEPDSLRGPQHHFAWADEIAKWPQGEACWTNMELGLRLGTAPQVMATTTPRPVPLLRRLMGQEGVVITKGRTSDNAAALPHSFIQAMERQYGDTRLGRQELEGEMITDLVGALWTRDGIEDARVAHSPDMMRIVIGVDPPAGSVTGKTGDACGIIVCGLGSDGRGYVLADASVKTASPEGWARAVADAAEIWDADRVIAEANQGGRMVESVLRAANVALPVKLVHASRGKVARAEPVAALFEAGRASFTGGFAALEDELCGLIVGGGYEGPGKSPDRADALVWAMTELMLGKARIGPRVRVV